MRALFAAVFAVALAAGAFLLWAGRHEALPAVETPSRASFPAAQIERGEQLAGLGGCASCHTAPGGQPLAGGLALPTPFGTIHATNITPDRETGIGTWSLAAFQRAMREGLDREGRHLYPAFPYDHFAKVDAADIESIYAYLMTRPAVRARAPENALMVPFGFRPLLAGWKLLFHDAAPFRPVAGRDELWNLGAYYVEGLGHCGACHSPRNALGAVDRGAPLAGGLAEGWFSPALGAQSPAPVAWSRDALLNYLIDGWDADHGVAAGPMTAVVNNLSRQPERVVEAMATFLASLSPPQDEAAREAAIARAKEQDVPGQRPQAPATGQEESGEAIFLRACANCHRRGSQTVPLGLATTLRLPEARNTIRVVLEGIRPPEGAPERSMPAFASSLPDDKMAALVAFMRSRFTPLPPWNDLEGQVRAARAGH